MGRGNEVLALKTFRREVPIVNRIHPPYQDLKARYEALELQVPTQILHLREPIISPYDNRPMIFYNAGPLIGTRMGEDGKPVQKIDFWGRLESYYAEDSRMASGRASKGELVDIHVENTFREDPHPVTLDGVEYEISVKAWRKSNEYTGDASKDSEWHTEIAYRNDIEHPIGKTPVLIKGMRVIPAKGLSINGTPEEGTAEDGYIVYFRPRNETGEITIDGVTKTNVVQSEIRRMYVKRIEDIQPETFERAMEDDRTLLLRSKETWGGLGPILIGKDKQEIIIGHMGISLNNGVDGQREYGITALVKEPNSGFANIQMILEEQDFEFDNIRRYGERLNAKRPDLKPIVYPTGIIFVKKDFRDNEYDTLITCGVNDTYVGIAKIPFMFLKDVDFDNPYNQQFVVSESAAREAFPDIYPPTQSSNTSPDAETLSGQKQSLRHRLGSYLLNH